MHRLIALACLCLSGPCRRARTIEREQRWADQILPSLMVGDAVWLTQEEGHKFLGLYTEAKKRAGR